MTNNMRQDDGTLVRNYRAVIGNVNNIENINIYTI